MHNQSPEDMPLDTIVTPLLVACHYRKERREAFQGRSADGPVLKLAKWLAGFWLWHGPIECFIVCGLYVRGTLRRPIRVEDALGKFRRAVEWYWIMWTALLMASYGAAVWALQNEHRDKSVVKFTAIVSAAICGFRLVEILATSVRLHFVLPYKTGAPAHALLLVFLAFFQVGLGFASLYCGDSFFCCDPFGKESELAKHWVTAFYFSMVTLGTLGYGDISPQKPIGRVLVIIELFYGLLLLVVAFQKALGGADWKRPSCQPEQPQKDSKGH